MIKSQTRQWSTLTFNQIVTGFIGLWYALAGVALLLAPAWFFATIGPFPPFNRHYQGDTGAFLLPLGLGLLLAAGNLARHRVLVVVGAAASLLHAANHFYDGLLAAWPPERWLTDTVPLALVAGALLWVLWRLPARRA
jgi:hypothetical protein